MTGIVAAFEEGYQLALGKPVGWDAPHPMNREHPRYFHAGMNSALAQEDRQLSFFLRVIAR